MLPSGSAARRINAFLRAWHKKHSGRAIAKARFIRSTLGTCEMPPHVTLVSSGWLTKRVFKRADSLLKEFARNAHPFTITIDGFGMFGKHVLFMCVKRTKKLLAYRNTLVHQLVDGRSFTARTRYNPHLTIFVDHSKGADLRRLLKDLSKTKMHLKFKVHGIALLCPQSRSRWDVVKKYSFRTR